MTHTIPWGAFDAILFDLDGVLTPTAEVHMRAWSEMFNEYLATVPGQAPYTDGDYFAHVDGKPRYDGVRDFLTSRGIVLPEGTPEDDEHLETVCGLGNRKNSAFNEVLARDGVEPYPGSVAFLDALARRGGVEVAVVSSSSESSSSVPSSPPSSSSASALSPVVSSSSSPSPAARSAEPGPP